MMRSGVRQRAAERHRVDDDAPEQPLPPKKWGVLEDVDPRVLGPAASYTPASARDTRADEQHDGDGRVTQEVDDAADRSVTRRAVARRPLRTRSGRPRRNGRTGSR